MKTDRRVVADAAIHNMIVLIVTCWRRDRNGWRRRVVVESRPSGVKALASEDDHDTKAACRAGCWKSGHWSQ